MLPRGLVNLEAVHGEPFYVLSGADAGLTFVGVVEFVSDQIMDSFTGEDPRGKRVVHFNRSNAPALGLADTIRDATNRKWRAVRKPGDDHLTVDYELTEITVKDT